jgi:predicted RNA binding protein YcfA (HicA-like mRNA interferase family)
VGNVPVPKPAEVVARLRKLDFDAVRPRGAHKQLPDNSGWSTTVLFHPLAIMRLLFSARSQRILDSPLPSSSRAAGPTPRSTRRPRMRGFAREAGRRSACFVKPLSRRMEVNHP